MADPIGTFSGLASGIQWRDMVDQIMQIETQRRLTPLTDRQTALKGQATAWGAFQAVIDKFRQATTTLRQSTAFDVFAASATQSSVSGRDLIAVSGGAGAAAGQYAVEVLQTARSEKIGSAVVSSSASALGLTGSFAINGRQVSVAATDTLASLRDKINAVNAGSNPSGVSATVLSAPTGVRLVLTANNTGASGIETVDDASGTFTALGFTDGSVTSNIDTLGAAQTQRFTSSQAAVGSLVAVSLPPATTIKVGGFAIAVDFSTDSLTSIAAKINAASGNTNAARVTSSTVSGVTSYRLTTDLTVQSDAGDLTNSARALSVLGFTRAGRADVSQTIVSANAFTDASTGLAATNATLLTDLQVNGQSLGVVNGDTLNVGGARGDGTSVARTLAITGASTLADLLGAVNDNTNGFGATPRTATASLVAGRISVGDNTAGDSQLSVVLTVQHADTSVVSLGAFGTGNGGLAGRSRQITAGADAVLRVDGQLVQRSSNTITDAISGLTLNALVAEVGTTVDVSVSRDTSAIVKSMQDFTAAYNAVRSFITTNSASGAKLAGNSSLRAIGSNFTSQLLNNVIGATGGFTSAAIAGLQHDRDGVLSLDAATFTAALGTNFNDIRTLFTTNGTASDSEVSYVTSGTKTQASASPYAIAITQAATRASITGASWTTYATAGTPDTMTITDASTGYTGNVSLVNGDSIATVAQKLNAMFATQKMRVSASVSVDNRIVLDSTDYGTVGGFTVAYTPGSADGTAMLGIGAQAYAGLDVAGTINGAVGTGKGQTLTGAVDDASEGLAISYTGTTARAAGTLTFTLGVAGMLDKAAQQLIADDTGSIIAQQDNANTNASALDNRIADVTQRIVDRRQSLINQFVAMESAMAKAQSVGNWLTSQFNALNSSN